MANIRERNGAYRIDVYIGEDRNGKKLFERTTFHPTQTSPTKIKKEVESFAVEFEKRVKEGRYLKGDKLTFSEVMDFWKEDQSFKDLTLSVQEGYVRTLERIALPEFGNLPIAKITPLHVQTVYNRMEKDGKAPKTIKRANTAINAVMSYAYRMEIIENNPCARVRLPKLQHSEELRYFTLDQSQTFLNALTRDYKVHFKGHSRTLQKTGETYYVPDYCETHSIPLQWQVYFTIALYSGFRRGEMIALTWKDIDFDSHTISVTKSIAKTTGKGQIVKDTKTKAGKRTIKLPSVCFDLLRKWKVEQKNFSLTMGTQWKGHRGRDFDLNPIFIQTETNCGCRMDVDTPTGKFRSILTMYNDSVENEEDKLPLIRLHDLRHTSATLLLAEGVDIETVSHRLGHAHASITLDVYGHALKSMDETASDRLEELFKTGTN